MTTPVARAGAASSPPSARARSRWATGLVGALLVVLSVVSLFTGTQSLSLSDLARLDAGQVHLLAISRVPRTLAAILSGMCVAVAGSVMQLAVRNRFVSPTTAGTTQFALGGLLVMAIWFPSAPLVGKMVSAAVFSVVGSLLFVALLRALPRRRTSSDVTVPLVGMMLGGIVEAVTTFFAWRYDLLQSLGSWTVGDLSTVLAGRYELLWIVAALVVLVYLAADRLTVAGLGRETAVGLGLHYERTIALALVIASVTTAISVVVVGTLPFLGLVVPNVASRLLGDNLRRTLPWVALAGGVLTLACDIVGRLVRYPYEVSLSVIMGVIGSAGFLIILLRSVDRG